MALKYIGLNNHARGGSVISKGGVDPLAKMLIAS